jgi:TP901 family phage tail tape measure protein
MASYEAYLGVGIDASGAQMGANQFAGATDKVSAAAQKAAAANAKFQQQVNQAAMMLKFFATAAVGLTIRSISEYTYAMSSVQAVTKATADDMVQLERITRELGATTQFTSAQAAEGAKFLGMAGFTTNQILEALPATLDLAAAATLSMGQAADITSNIMSGFGLAANQAGRAADVLAAIASSANTDVTGMGQAMKYVGPIARSLGISMEDTAAAIGVLANQGIQGSMAGTGLKTSLSTLVNPSKAAQAAIQSLNLTTNELNPQFNRLDDIIRKLAESGLDAERAFQIFGQRGATAMLALTGDIPGLEKLIGVTNAAAGSAQRMAKIMIDNVKGDADLLKSALTNLTFIIGDAGLTKAVRGFIQEATRMATSLGELLSGINKNREQAQALADVLNVVKNAIIAIMVLKFADWLFVAGNAMRALNLAMSANPYTMLAVGLGTLALHLKDLQKETDNLTEYTNKQTDALEQMGNKGVVAANKVRIAMLEAQRESIGVLAEINNQIDAMNRSAKEQEDVKKRMYDPFGAKQKMAGASDPGTFNALVETQHNRDIGLLLKKKAAIEEIDKKIAGLNTTVKVFGDISDTNFMKAQRAAERMLGIAGGFVGGNVIGGKPAASAESKSSASGKSKINDIIQPREKPIYDNDGMMSMAFQQMGVLKQESDKIIATFKQQEESKQKYMEGVKKLSEAEQRRLELNIALGDDAAEIDTQMQMYNATREYGLEIGSEEYRQLEEQINAQKTAAVGLKELEKARANDAEQARKASEAQKQWNNQLTYAFKDAIMNSKNLGDALSNLANRVQDMLVNKALDSLLGGMFASMKFAKGAAFQAGGVTAFASGGVVNSPTMFPMRGGVGLMGEAGAEAIMPLTRTSSGDLGVKAVGSGSTVIAPQITINVSGGTKEQNEDAGKRVSAAVRQAIDDTVVSVIMREKRPGGVLNAA